jgi:hypothetical protein
MIWGLVAGQNWQAEQMEFLGLYAMEMRRRRLESCCVMVGVSSPPFMGQGRERRGHV